MVLVVVFGATGCGEEGAVCWDILGDDGCDGCAWVGLGRRESGWCAVVDGFDSAWVNACMTAAPGLKDEEDSGEL